jgi:hypothetical protein
MHQSALKGGFDWLRMFMAAEQSLDGEMADGRTNVPDRSIKEAMDKEAASCPAIDGRTCLDVVFSRNLYYSFTKVFS